jgi:hypothetical protein
MAPQAVQLEGQVVRILELAERIQRFKASSVVAKS